MYLDCAIVFNIQIIDTVEPNSILFRNNLTTQIHHAVDEVADNIGVIASDLKSMMLLTPFHSNTSGTQKEVGIFITSIQSYKSMDDADVWIVDILFKKIVPLQVDGQEKCIVIIMISTLSNDEKKLVDQVEFLVTLFEIKQLVHLFKEYVANYNVINNKSRLFTFVTDSRKVVIIRDINYILLEVLFVYYLFI